MENPDPDEFVFIEPNASCDGVFLNLRHRLKNVAETQ
jgi:hypothetical protein